MPFNTASLYYKMPYVLQNLVLSAYGYRLKKVRYGDSFQKRLNFLKRSFHWDQVTLREYQDSRLRKIVCHAYQTVPYYQKLFDRFGIKPTHIRTQKDLNIIPTLTKGDILKDPQAFMSRRIEDNVIKLSTSGSTGSPLEISTGYKTISYYHATVARQLSWFGVEPKDKHATFNGRLICEPDRKTRKPFRKNYSSNQTLFALTHLDNFHREYMVEEILSGEYSYINGYPSSLQFLSSSPRFNSSKPQLLKVILTSSESLSELQRCQIEQAFGCTIADHYNSTEMVCGFSQHRDGIYYHDAEDSIAELQGSGRLKSLICTGLNNYVMPLIRYDIGDTVEKYEGSDNLARLAVSSIGGRVDDVVITPTGSHIGRLDHILKGVHNIVKAQISQVRADKVIIKVVPSDFYSDVDASRIKRNAQERLTGMKIEVLAVDSIPAESNGKFKFVKNEL